MSHGSISDTVQLRGGVSAPRYVFGTGGITTSAPIHYALTEGYRAFDTAQQYNNESEVGAAIRSYSGKVNRSDLFIISKVNRPGSSVEETLEGIRESVKRVNLGGYIDLFLIHNPNYGPEGRKIEWQALERAKEEGIVKAIGVSNFVVRHLQELKAYARELPAVNQTELSPFWQDKQTAQLCHKEGIQLQAFAPLARGQKAEDPRLIAVADEVGKPWNKLMLRYAFQKGWMVTCKSATPARIADNVDIFDFELSQEQMKKLDGLDCGFKVTPSTISDVEKRAKYYEDMP